MPVEIKFSKKHKIKEDRFIETLFSLQKKTQDLKKPAMYGLVGVLVAGLIVFLTFNYRKHANAEARALFGQALLSYQSGQYTQAITGFKQITENYGGSSSASKAMFMLAGLYYDLGNYALAVEAYKKYIEKYNETGFMNAAVYQGLGSAYAQVKDYPNAINAFNSGIRKYPNDFSVPATRYKLARCYLETQKPGQARAELETILRDNPKSAAAKEAGLLLATL